MNNVLSMEQIHSRAPSVFTMQAHHSRSDRYGFIPTAEIIRPMMDEGWMPVDAGQTIVRDRSRVNYTRHMLRFRQHDAAPIVGDSYPEVVLYNSHDGTSAFQLYAGLFRLVCSNGMVVAESSFGSIRVRHSKHAPDEVVEAAGQVIEAVPQIAEKLEQYQQIELNDRERLTYGQSALIARYGDVKDAPISADDVTRPRRLDDRKPDLWTTYNTVQENLVRGGIRGRAKTGRRTTTRPIKSVNEDLRINKALWHLAEQMADLKTAA